MPQPSSHQQSSPSHTSDEPPPPQTSVASPLLATDWRLPDDGFASSSFSPFGPFVEQYPNISCPGSTFYLLPQPTSHVASDGMLCVLHSTFSADKHNPWEHTWKDVYSTSLLKFGILNDCILTIAVQSNAFLSSDDFSIFLGLLLKTPSRCISLDIYDTRLLRSSSITPSAAPWGKWRRLVTKRFSRHPSKENSVVFYNTPPIRLSFSVHDPTNTLYIYLEGPGSNSRDVKPVVEAIKRLLSLDAMIMLDDLNVEETYASLVAQLLPLLFDRGSRRLRLHQLPAASSTSLLPSCVKLPDTLVLDFSSPDSINAFVSWLPRILTSSQDDFRARPLKLDLCFKYDAVLITKGCMLWSDFDNILADHAPTLITFKSLDTIDNVPDDELKALLGTLLPKAQKKLSRVTSS